MPPLKERQHSFGRLADELLTRGEFRTLGINLARLVRTAIADLNARIDARLSQVRDGYTPVKGKDYFDGKNGYTPVKGKDYFDGSPGTPGADANEVAIAARIAAEITPLIIAEVEKHLPALGNSIHDSLRLLPESDRPHISLFAGLEEYVKETLKKHGYLGSGGAAVSVMQSGAMKVQTAAALNFKGAGAPTVSIGANGVTNLDFPSGGGFTPLAATETPNGSLTVFTFSTATAQPTYLVVDNVWMKATTKAGTVNWTWASGPKQATLTIPPADDIWGVV